MKVPIVKKKKQLPSLLKDVFFSGFTLVQLLLWYNVTDLQ